MLVGEILSVDLANQTVIYDHCKLPQVEERDHSVAQFTGFFMLVCEIL